MDANNFFIEDEPLPGVYLLRIQKFLDDRGFFLKGFQVDKFQQIGIKFEPQEQFFSYSSKNVLRGMHFQAGESAHQKLVYCPIGYVLDVVVDVRPTSERFNQPYSIKLTQDSPLALLIGEGYAHGFLSLVEGSCMQYMTTRVHDPSRDFGVLWSSINFDWPIQDPILSDRDKNHPPIELHSCEFF